MQDTGDQIILDSSADDPLGRQRGMPFGMLYARIMRRTTIMLPDDMESRLRLEARRRGVPMAEIVREAVERHLPRATPGKRLSFFAIGEGGPADASERVDDYVKAAMSKKTKRRRAR
jgi:hypothetical protein